MNAKQAHTNYKLWLSWYPGDIKGAVAFASDHLDTESDLDELEALIKADMDNMEAELKKVAI